MRLLHKTTGGLQAPGLFFWVSQWTSGYQVKKIIADISANYALH
jgi:hypothetical protein